MAQHSDHRDGFDTQQYLLQSSPTIGRTQPTSSVGSSQGSSSASADKVYRSQRKAAPSPLQTSTTAVSSYQSPTPTRTTFGKSQIDTTPRTVESVRYTPPRLNYSDQPRSPKERLDDLLASERSFYDADDTPESVTNGIDSRVHQSIKPQSAGSRSVSDPISPLKNVEGPLANTRVPMASTAPAHRVDMGRTPLRTSSIDSAISSISSGTHSHTPSQDSQIRGTELPDVSKLVRAAGSPEAVIQYLLKEKQSQAAQNTQLWRLVDKQRAMILGLNKDLERALKDKDRYRKKLKESLALIPENPNQVVGVTNPGEQPSPDAKSVEFRSGNVAALVSAGMRDPQFAQDDLLHSPVDITLAPYPITPPANQLHLPIKPISSIEEAEHKMPSPSEHAFQRYDADASATGFELGQHQRKAADDRELPYDVSVPPSRSMPLNTSRDLAPKTPSTLQASSLAIAESSPNIDQTSRFPPPPRKPPPAPLNLGRQNDTSSHLRQADSADEADSDYDDVLEVEEIPAFTERGRRKTREQDDRERELAALKDAEMRSLSKKSKSRPTAPKEKGTESLEDPMPQQSRQAVQISPPNMQLRQMALPDSSTGSLAGMLSSADSSTRGSDISTNQTITLPPMSPGLPLSPRPMGRGMASPLPRNPRDGGSQSSSLASPPMSPRSIASFPGSMPLSPRAPRQPIPLPPNTPLSMTSPRTTKGEPAERSSSRPLETDQKQATTIAAASTNTNVVYADGIYRGLLTEDYPDLLLPPNALPSIDVRVASSRLKPSRASLMFPNKIDEDPVFTLAVFSRSNRQELWRVQKDSQSLAQLDNQLKSSLLFTAKVPDKALFIGHAPAKIDARRLALDTYLEELLNTNMDEPSALEICRYLSTNTLEPHAEDSVSSVEARGESPLKFGHGGRSTKNGYLTKRGKNFGGWKARFFVLDGPVLKYYEAPGGAHLGMIKLQHAQIGKQQQQTENSSPSRGDPDDVENQYRHAFLILEPKRKDSSSLVRHVLCAESDGERDDWVAAIRQYIDHQDSDGEEGSAPGHNRDQPSGSNHGTKKKTYGQGRVLNIPEVDEGLVSIGYHETAQGEIPHGVDKERKASSGTPSPPMNGYDRDPLSNLPHSQSSKSISAPKNATIIQDTGAWGNKPTMLAPVDDRTKETKAKKRGFFNFGSKPRPSSESQEQLNSDSTSSLSQMSYEQHGPIRAVFGVPLVEAVRYNHPVDINVDLPAVVYRCIEYLDAKNAAGEEGIFRLSGSNVVIKALRERFNVEGDVNLITDDQYYDIHAVASLLKLYLRELPTTILTRELHLEFLAVTEIHDVKEKISALNGLVHRLPPANGALLRYLSGHLINIINHADVNKMTVRNVGIVFSPTLNIPAPVFALFLQQYEGIFGSEPDQDGHPHIEVTVTAPPLTPEDIRSPRRQIFQDLPTPSYNQPSFSRGTNNFPQPRQGQSGYDQGMNGFAPIQPSYEAPSFGASQTMGGPEYGQLAPTLAGPAYDQYNVGHAAYKYDNDLPITTTSKSKRRESSMFGMGLGQKQPGQNKMKDDSRLVDEESFFE